MEKFTGTTDYTGAGFADSFHATDSNGKQPYKDNLGVSDGSKILLLIPQTKSNVEFEVEYKVTDGGVTYRRSAKANIDWKAGEIHTYSFTINKVDVKVEDTVSGLKKSNVVTTNTGNVTAYLRATCVLAWFYGETVVAPYTGEFNPGLGTNWQEIDGYYYYKLAVQPGQATANALFDSWTAPGENN